MADASGWSSQLPSGSSTLRDSDNQFRSHQSILEATLNQEHYAFSTSSNVSAGVHQPGSARPYVGAASSVSTAADQGRLMWTTDAQQLVYVGHDSLVTHASLGTTNYFPSQQSFGEVLASTVTAADLVVSNEASASTFTGAIGHHDTVIASDVSTGSITGLSSLSVSRVTAGALTVNAAEGVPILSIGTNLVVFPAQTLNGGDSASTVPSNITFTAGDTAFATLAGPLANYLVPSVQAMTAGAGDEMKVMWSNITSVPHSLSTTTVHVTYIKYS